MSASQAPPATELPPDAPWRPDRAELLSVASALGLLLTMFAFEWFGVAGVPGRSNQSSAVTTAVNAWDALTTLRWLMVATIAVTLASLLLHLSQRRHGSRTDTGAMVTLLGASTAVLVGYRVLIQLPRPAAIVDQKLGAVLGVFCAIGIALGAFESLRSERARARRLSRTRRHGRGGARVPRAR
jgi:hypothetical protein